MKTRAMIIALLLCSIAVQAQEWNYRMHRNDRLVYQEAASGKLAIVRLGIAPGTTIPIFGDQLDTASVEVYVTQIPRFLECMLGGCISVVNAQTVDSSGIVVQFGPPWMSSYREMYPTFVPATDTLLLRYEEHGLSITDATYNYRAFDTLVFGKTVRALSFNQVHIDTTFDIVVSEVFGYLWIKSKYQDWKLTSAIIGELSYNRVAPKFSVFPTCTGSLWQYETSWDDSPSGPGSAIREYRLRDTLIDGKTYYRPGDMLWHFTDMGPYRVENGIAYIHDGYREWPLDSTMLPGSFTPDGMIADTGTVMAYGKMRKYIRTVWSWGYSTWVEGIGLTHVSTQPQFYWADETYLVYANICGEEYGEYVGIREIPEQTTSHIFSAPYPNPVSLGQGSVSLTAMQHPQEPVQIAVYDALGRRVYRNHVDNIPDVHVPLASMHPGVYYVVAIGGGMQESHKLVVTP